MGKQNDQKVKPVEFKDLTPEEKIKEVTKKRAETLREKFDRELGYGPISGKLSPEEIQKLQDFYNLANVPPKSRKVHYIKRDDVRKKEDTLSEIKNKFDEAGHELKELSAPIPDIIHAIFNKEEIEGTPLHEKILDPNFRFVSSANPIVSKELSEIFALNAKLSAAQGFEEGWNQGAKKASKAAANKRMIDADEFAKNIFSIVEKVKSESGESSIRGTVNELNKKGIESPNGGKWNTSTFQLIQKRWKQLGLGSSSK